ncbi:Listeria/Bacterioides repeat-containing protein [Lachnospiraceae bacterium G41]|nr:Listeria/Bacterioides repeat-containing protein [Lachnospiraceae bacterium G41]
MKKSGRKVLSVILTAVMVFALLPVFGKPMVLEAAPGTHTHNRTDNLAHLGWMPIATKADLQKWMLKQNEGTSVSGYLIDDITINGDYYFTGGEEYNLCLNGHSITQKLSGPCITIEKGATLNLYDVINNDGSLTHDKGVQGPGIFIKTGGTLNMYGGKISNNYNYQIGGGIDQNGGTVNMYGGEISNNTANEAGGVYICGNGTFNLYGGIISENKAEMYPGGGIFISDGTLDISGGEITKNSSKFSGGGVYCSGYNPTKLVISGGKITDNKSEGFQDAETGCGGIFTREMNVEFVMLGGIVSGNSTDKNHYGIMSDRLISITGGYIYDHIKSNINTYSVTFDANGGTGNMPTQYVPGNTDMPIGKNQFTNSGKVFVEWNTEKDGSGTSYADEDKINIDKDTTLYAQWTDPNVNSYKVTFKVDNGTWNDGTTKDKVILLKRKAGEIKLLRVDSSAIPEVGNKPYFKYKAGKWDGSFKKVISEDTTFIYSYEFDVPYEITFDENWGSSNSIKDNTDYDHKLKQIPTPSSSREGYDFEGWYTDKKDGEKITTETVFDSETTVYAHWKAHNYTVVFDANGGSGNMDNQKREYDSTEPLTKNTFTKDGNTFMGWNTDKNGLGDGYSDKAIANLTSEDDVEITLFAMWNPNAYKVTLNEGNGTINTGNITDYTYGVGAKLPTASDMTLTGYTFDGWYDNAGLTGTAITEISTTDIGDKEFYAKFTPNSYTVKFDANGGSGNMDNQKREYDSTEPLTENTFTKDGNTFMGWNTDKNGLGDSYSDKAIANLTSENDVEVTLFAMWNPNAYKVTLNEGNGTINTGNITGYTYGVGAKLPTASDMTLTGYTFEGWYDNAGLTGTAITEISTTDIDDKEFYANWTPNPYTVVFDANGGSGNMLNMDRIYDDGLALTENAYSFEAHSFNGWNTKSDGTGTAYKDKYLGNLSITAGEVVTLYAQWDDVVYTINATNDGNGTATVSDDTGIKGTTITVTAIPNDGYKFAGWEVVSGSVSLTDAKSSLTTFTLGAENAVVKATFEEITKEPQSGSMEPTKPGTPEEPTNPTTPEEPSEPGTPEEFKTPEEPTEPGTEDLTDLETENPEEEIPAKDWLDDLRLQLQIAAELTGPQTVKYSGDFALSYDIMLYLVEHPDITLIYTVTYEGVDYTITIPGGKAIADPNIPWYGPLWLLANYGGDNVPEVLAGSGRYTVVAGDTLSGIAAKFNTTVEELVRKNGIENPNYIIVGQVIVY